MSDMSIFDILSSEARVIQCDTTMYVCVFMHL